MNALHHPVRSAILCLSLSFAGLAADTSHRAPATNQPMVDDYKITVLSDMIPGRRTIAEWGFSALIEVTSGGVTRKFLFDTGGNPQTVVTNARTLNINICDVQDVILTHYHDDHTLGLETLRGSCQAANPNAFKNTYVGSEEIFLPRFNGPTAPNSNILIAARARYQANGGTFIINERPTPQFLGLPGVWLTGKIPRTYDEKTNVNTINLQTPDGKRTEDFLPEEIALIINTPTGMVVVTGCAHAGITNTIEAAQAILAAKPPVTLVGGIHFFPLPLGEENTEGIPGTLLWEARQLRNNGVEVILASHCTGFERFQFLRNFLGLDDAATTFSSVGTTLSMQDGFGYTLPYTVNLPLHPGWQTQLQWLTCGSKPPNSSCQASVSVWNYYLMKNVSPAARPLIVGQGTQMMTVQQYLAARAALGM